MQKKALGDSSVSRSGFRGLGVKLCRLGAPPSFRALMARVLIFCVEGYWLRIWSLRLKDVGDDATASSAEEAARAEIFEHNAQKCVWAHRACGPE